MIIKANLDETHPVHTGYAQSDLQKLIIRSDYSLRRIEDEIRKMNLL